MNTEDNPPTHQHDEEPLIPSKYKVYGLGLLVMWGFSLLIFGMLCCDERFIARAASLGDAFGTLNSLFSVLALGAAIAGILIQGKEFRKQVEEMTKSSVEMEEQTTIYRQQLTELQTQTRHLRREREKNEIQTKIEALPYLLVSWSQSNQRIDISIKNAGADVFQVRAKLHGVDAVWGCPVLKAGSGSLSFHSACPTNSRDLIIVNVQYVLKLGNELAETIELPPEREPSEVFYSDRAKQVKNLSASFKLGRVMASLTD